MTPRSYEDSARILRSLLLLATEPVGVRVLRSAAEVASSAVPLAEPPLHYCSAVRRASLGESVTLTAERISCDTAPRTLGFVPGFFDDEFIESYVTVGLYADRDRADRVLADVPVLQGTSGLLVRPLVRFDAETPPDVIIMALSPYAAMRVTQAAGFHGHRVRNEPIGMHGICAECTARPILTGQASISLLCSGTRHVAGWDENELAIGVPTHVLPDIVDGLWDSVARYETDGRKDTIRRACSGGGADRPIDGPEPDGLEPGTAYFHRP